MRHKLTQLISVIIIAAFAIQSLAWGQTHPTPLSPGQNLRPLASRERQKKMDEGSEAAALRAQIEPLVAQGRYKEALEIAYELEDFDESASELVNEIHNLQETADDAVISVRSMSHSAGTDAIQKIIGLADNFKNFKDKGNAEADRCMFLIDEAKERIQKLHREVKGISIERSLTTQEIPQVIAELRVILGIMVELENNAQRIPRNILEPELEKYLLIRIAQINGILENRIRFAQGEAAADMVNVRYLVERSCKANAGYEGDQVYSRVHIENGVDENLQAAVDELTIVNCVGNLITNALEHTSDEATVLVTTGQSDRFLVISVKNTGDKIKPAMLRKDRFGVPILCYLNVSTKEDVEPGKEGRGLGTAEARRSAELHQGHLKYLDDAERSPEDAEWSVIAQVFIPLGKEPKPGTFPPPDRRAGKGIPPRDVETCI